MSAQPQPPRWQRWLLFGSLAANLAVLGLVAGLFLSGGGPGGAKAPRLDVTLGPVMSALPPEDRQALRAAIAEGGRIGPPERRALRADYQQMLDLLRSDSFDPDQLAEIIGRQRGRVADVQNVVLEALIERIAGMDGATRAAFADALEQELASRRR